jgi:hypothetical protein
MVCPLAAPGPALDMGWFNIHVLTTIYQLDTVHAHCLPLVLLLWLRTTECYQPPPPPCTAPTG